MITSCYGQQTGTPVLFISNHDCKLFIDGVEISPLSNNAPFKIYLNSGDHITQAKSEIEIVTQTVSCIDSKQKVVSFNFSDNYTKNVAAGSSDPREQLILHDLVTFHKDVVRDFSTIENKYFSFDTNDKIKFSYQINDPGSTLNLIIFSYPDHKIIYSKKNISDLNDSITIVSKEVYYFSMSNNNAIKKSATIKISRIPSSTSRLNFKTNVISRPDTTFSQISADTYIVKKDKLSIPIAIPKGSTFWAYWIGIGNEAIINYDNYAALYAEGISGYAKNPLYAFGTGKLDVLTKVNSQYVIDYGFADKANTGNFLAAKQYDLFSIKPGKNITTDFARVDVIKNEMHLLVSIPQVSMGQKMKLVVAAFQVKDNYVIDPADE